MAKITDDARQQFNQEAEGYKRRINECLEKEKNILTVIKGNAAGAAYQKIMLAEEMIYVATLYIAINGSSLKIPSGAWNVETYPACQIRSNNTVLPPCKSLESISLSPWRAIWGADILRRSLQDGDHPEP